MKYEQSKVLLIESRINKLFGHLPSDAEWIESYRRLLELSYGWDVWPVAEGVSAGRASNFSPNGNSGPAPAITL